MRTAEWVFVAATEILAHDPALSFSQAREVAQELQEAWPGLGARDAVAFFFTPSDHLPNGCAVELR